MAFRMTFRIPFFRIFYSTSYLIFVGFLVVLLAVTPGDHIYQTIDNGRIGNVFVVGGVYVGAFLIAMFIYLSRLYTNRTTLGSIPKAYLPIDKGEVPARVYKEIVRNRHRSSLIAWESKPKDLSHELEKEARAMNGEHLAFEHNIEHEELDDASQISPQVTNEKSPIQSQFTNVSSSLIKPLRVLKRMAMRRNTDLEKSAKREARTVVIPVKASDPHWGSVIHPGWSSPSTMDLPGLQFDVVIDELPNLIEAKAVSLAPPDPRYTKLPEYRESQQSHYSMHSPPKEDAEILPPDPRAIAALQRPACMSLRGYITHLIRLGIINAPSLAEPFLKRYEYARFSTETLFESEFRDLMVAFSDLLGTMIEVAPDILIAEGEAAFGNMDEDEDDYDDDDYYDKYSKREISFANGLRPVSQGTSERRYETPTYDPDVDEEQSGDDTGSVVHHREPSEHSQGMASETGSVVHYHQSQSHHSASEVNSILSESESLRSSESTYN